MIDWKSKLTSRKLWMAIIGFVTGLLTFLGVGVEQSEQIGSLILMAASVVAYILGEGLIDAASAHANGVVEHVLVPGEEDEEEEPEE